MGSVPGDPGSMDVELLVVPDCPDSPGAGERLRQVLDEMGLTEVAFTRRVIVAQAQAVSAGFPGSPTFLVNGRGPFGGAGQAAGLTCWMYRTPNGLAGSPTCL